ncbi:2-phospho-L-lactate guanylyltransferase [Ancylobacter defluvii]|uniref:3-phospho-D-glycerate guanylyltransferase n=1 Tax=Ancylobacter defluvii TaxID=1282440 RepID=A0A9W6ND95_9HYPH|nr:2-phospho-L-lactate guanylyltransferase [Ancylobacter defluvii]MBS7588093.1 2-phospho-L-lactate guanylyltransferase [Ancylobacter defluvii]GLK86485.1 hypothetical protein GCM10017653_45550 [Ancylobacter defluvii]
MTAGRGAGGIWAVVPVKPFGLAKQRLAATLAPQARARLARAMLEDVLAALRQAEAPPGGTFGGLGGLDGFGGLAGTLIVSAEPAVAELARAYRAEWLAEPEVAGLNAALARAARHLAARRAAGLMVLPGDIPGLAAAEVAQVIAAHPAGGVSLVAAHDGQGTNALLATPPEVIGFAFGPGSLAAHRAAVQAAGVPVRVHAGAALPGLGFDVDAPGDLAWLARLPAESRTRQALAAEGVSVDRT